MKKLHVLVCNHYDVAWRRRYKGDIVDGGKHYVSYTDLQREGIRENIRLCREFPDYKFNIETVRVARDFLASSPDWAEELAALVAAGRVSVPLAGDNIIDANMTGGEAMFRNLLCGKRFLRETYGISSAVCVRNDAFGNPGQLPQTARLCGADWIYGLGYSPVTGDYWRGIDGTTLFVGNLPVAGSGGTWKKYAPCPACAGTKTAEDGRPCPACAGRGIDLAPVEDAIAVAADLSSIGDAEEALLLVTSEEALPSRKLTDWVAKNRAVWEIDYVTFDDLRERVADRITHTPEENEYHKSAEHNPNNTGCLVSRTETKRRVRRIESKLFILEKIAALAVSCVPYPERELDDIWDATLTLMAHDMIPGEHVDAVYDDFILLATDAERKIDALLAGYARPDGGRLTLVNPNGIPAGGTFPVELPDDGGYELRTADGTALPLLARNGRTATFLAAPVPADTAIPLFLEKTGDAAEDAPSDRPRAAGEKGNILQASANAEGGRETARGETVRIENRRFAVTADQSGLLEIFDKARGRVISAAGTYRPVSLVYEHDEGSPWATLSPDRAALPLRTELVSVERSDACESLTYAFALSGITSSHAIEPLDGRLCVRLARDAERVDVSLAFSVDDYNHRLCVVFPLEDAGDARYGIPFGQIRREPYEPAYYWAGANGDYATYRYAAIDGADGAVAVLERGTPCARVETADGKPAVIFSVWRSPTLPTYLHEPGSYSMTAFGGMRDAGRHAAEFALVSYDTPLTKSTVARDALAYQVGLTALPGVFAMPAAPTVVAGTAVIESLHRVDGKLLLRLVEENGAESHTVIRLPDTVTQARKTDPEGRPLPVSAPLVRNGEKEIRIPLRAFEIVTLLLE